MIDLGHHYKKYITLVMWDNGPRKEQRESRRAYSRLVSRIAADNETVLQAFGKGGWLSSASSEPYTSADALHRAAYCARTDGFPVWVSDANHNGAFWGDSHANLAFRAHHDAVHVSYKQGFDFEGECRTCYYTAGSLNLDHYSPEAAVLVSEIIGQGLYFDRHGRFPLRRTQPHATVSKDAMAWAERVLNTVGENL